MRMLLSTTLLVVASGCVRLGVAPRDAAGDHVGTEAGRIDGAAFDGRKDAIKDGPVNAVPPKLDGAKLDGAKPDGAKHDGAKPDTLKPDQQAGDGGNVPPTGITIAKGTFTMGSPTSEPCRSGDEAQHQVTLTHDVELLSTEVTQGQFLAAMGYNPSAAAACGSSCPVENVTWHEAAAYCNALSLQKGYATCYQCSGSAASVACQEAAAYSGQNVFACPGYRLPTDAEWEHAYRAGTTTAMYNGAVTASCSVCGAVDANADKIAWYCANTSATKPVKGKQPNAWGLYDMAGNVREWVHDWYQSTLGSQPVIDPWGAPTGLTRVVRTGSYTQPVGHMRAARRSDADPVVRSGINGFRWCRTK